MRRILFMLLIITLAASCTQRGPFQETYSLTEKEFPNTGSVSLLSFNIRYATAKDAEQRWRNRRQLAINVMRDSDADIICLQEALHQQLRAVRQALPTYASHAIGRKDGYHDGEHVPVLYRSDRFSPLRAGHFWLSETPDQAGSISWNARKPRVCSWIILHDHGNGERLLIANTHLDHASALARSQSIALLIKRLSELRSHSDALIICGDFNEDCQSELHQQLCDGLALKNAHEAIHQHYKGTFHHFTGKAKDGWIDWVLHSTELQVAMATLIKTGKHDLYASDHFPLSVQFVIQEETP